MEPMNLLPCQYDEMRSVKMSQAVIVNEVYKRFGKLNSSGWPRPRKANPSLNGHKPQVVAVDRVSFSVRAGEIFGVLGPNGSGKSPLIRLIAPLLLPDSGTIQVFGQDVVRQPMQVQRQINRVSVEASFFKKLSPMENLVYGAPRYGLDGGETRLRGGEILPRLG